MAKAFVYVSAAKAAAIDIFALDPGTGALSPLGSRATGENVMPLALGPDETRLYAAIRSEPYRVESFAIDRSSGMLEPLAVAPLPASMPSITTALAGRLLLGASYQADLAAVSAIEADGAVRHPAVQILPTGRHAHAVAPDRTGRFVFAPCLGSDEIFGFRLDEAAGRLVPLDPPAVGTPPGFGPRHAVFSPDNRMFYVLGEFAGAIAAFRFDASTGRLTPAGVTPFAPSGLRPKAENSAERIWAADLQITRDGRFLYATERTSSTIAILARGEDGALSAPIAHVATEAQPRGIRIDPSGRFLVASGERSDHIAAYAIDAATGLLALASRAPVGAGANWVEIVAPAGRN